VNVAVCRSPSGSTAVTVCLPAVNLRSVPVYGEAAQGWPAYLVWRSEGSRCLRAAGWSSARLPDHDNGAHAS
jgi:hypothetical protein